ncbi:MAG: hypothetical protein M1826_005617, partial [Phylliscum demangeonii]
MCLIASGIPPRRCSRPDEWRNRGVGAYVRLFAFELECPAIDMNEITWCPDKYYCTASCTSCTNGKT